MSADRAITDAIDAVIAEIMAAPDRELGGPAAADARRNVHSVADYLRGLARSNKALPRHAGNPSAGKVATAISTTGARFNRQNFSTNRWCARLLEVYGEWEDAGGQSALDEARRVADSKEPTNRRIGDLEAEILRLSAENRDLRIQLARFREFAATTGRLP